MITIKKQENCQARGCFASLSGCRLDKLYPSTEMLEQALSHSLAIYVALDDDTVVGLIRLVGDGFSSVLVQDLIVFTYLSASRDW